MQNTNPEAWWKNTRGEWYVVVQGLLFLLVVFGPKESASLPRWSGAGATVASVFGVGFGSLGALFLLGGLRQLGKNLSALPHPRENASLVTSGAYQFVRHPIYAGLIAGAFGWALVNHSTLAILYAGILFLFFDVKSRREERFLRQTFATYAAYAQRVRKLIPFVY